MEEKGYIIVIPSSGRADQLATYKQLIGNVDCEVVLCVHENEFDSYKVGANRSHEKLGIRDIPDIMRHRCNKLPQIRDEIMRHMCDYGTVIMIDDDFRFFKRDADRKLHPAKPEDMQGMVDKVLSELRPFNVGMAGVSMRGGNNRYPDVEPNYRINGFLAVKTKVYYELHKKGIKFGEFDLAEDFWYCINLLNNCHELRTIFSYAYDQPQSGAAGGCSEYRTSEMQERVSREIHKRFPKYVRVTEKKLKHGWGDIGKFRYDLTIQWKKILTDAQERAKGRRFLSRHGW